MNAARVNGGLRDGLQMTVLYECAGNYDMHWVLGADAWQLVAALVTSPARAFVRSFVRRRSQARKQERGVLARHFTCVVEAVAMLRRRPGDPRAVSDQTQSR